MRFIKLSIPALFALQLLYLPIKAQEQKEADFKTACAQILESLSKKKINDLNGHVNKSYGVYVLYRIGVPDEYQLLKKLDGHLPFDISYHTVKATDILKYNLQYGKLPSYDCGESVWNKKTFMADSVKKYKPVSNIVAFHTKYDGLVLGKKLKTNIKFIEQNSRKVIFTGSKGDGFIFYVSYINGKWWLSIIDTVTTDCSA